MYTPAHNRETNQARIVAFMREFSFATLVTAREANIKATHLPFMIEERGAKLILSAHLARANDQWRDFGNGPILVIFQEPHAFISPRYYERELSVPTWNYVAVHAYGNAIICDSPEEKYAMIERLVGNTDPDYLGRFKALPSDFVASELRGFVAFDIEVTRLEARFKLSQDRTAKERENIIQALTGAGDHTGKRIGEMMRADLGKADRQE
ncbi:MAG TPA: FMN-binding negative transcriptional regulator [Anaerolineae bacterium]